FERAGRWVARQPAGRWRAVKVRDGEEGPASADSPRRAEAPATESNLWADLAEDGPAHSYRTAVERAAAVQAGSNIVHYILQLAVIAVIQLIRPGLAPFFDIAVHVEQPRLVG